MKKEHLIKELKDAWQIALLKKPIMHHVADDKSKTVFGYYFIIAAAILGAIGQQIFGGWFFTPTLGMSIGTAIVQIISTVIGIYVLSFVAKSIFKGSAAHDHFFRVAAYGMIVTWIGIIPNLSFIGGIWGLVILFVILKTVHKLTTGGIIGTFLVSIVIMAIVGVILSPIYARIGFGGMTYGERFNLGNKGFEMNVPGDEGGKVNVNDGKMRITTPDGEVIEIDIPSFE